LEFSAKKVVSFRKLGSYEGNSLISKTIQVRIPEIIVLISIFYKRKSIWDQWLV